MKNIFLRLLILIGFAMVMTVPNLTYAAGTPSTSVACQGVGVISGNGSCDSVKSSTSSLDGVLALVLDVLSVIVGLAAVIFIIIGGMKYVTSAGNPERTNDAKNTILYAVIGLLVVALAQIIVKFLLHKVSIL